MANVEEARTKYFEAKKTVEKSESAKRKLEERLEFLKLEIKEPNDTENQRRELISKLATGEIAQIAYDKKIAELQKEIVKQKSLCEQTLVIEDLLHDTKEEADGNRKNLLECDCQLFACIAIELEAKIRAAMPIDLLKQLRLCIVRAGRVYGRDGWSNMLNGLTNAGRFSDEEMEGIENNLRADYKF